MREVFMVRIEQVVSLRGNDRAGDGEHRVRSLSHPGSADLLQFQPSIEAAPVARQPRGIDSFDESLGDSGRNHDIARPQR